MNGTGDALLVWTVSHAYPDWGVDLFALRWRALDKTWQAVPDALGTITAPLSEAYDATLRDDGTAVVAFVQGAGMPLLVTESPQSSWTQPTAIAGAPAESLAYGLRFAGGSTATAAVMDCRTYCAGEATDCVDTPTRRLLKRQPNGTWSALPTWPGADTSFGPVPTLDLAGNALLLAMQPSPVVFGVAHFDARAARWDSQLLWLPRNNHRPGAFLAEAPCGRAMAISISCAVTETGPREVIVNCDGLANAYE
jgi:hypothetical protein